MGKNTLRLQLILKGTAQRKKSLVLLSGFPLPEIIGTKEMIHACFPLLLFATSTNLKVHHKYTSSAINVFQVPLTSFKSWIWILGLLCILHTAVRRSNELETAETVDLLDLFSQSMSPSLMYHRTAQAGRNLERSSNSAFHGKWSLEEIIWHPVTSWKPPAMGILSCPWGSYSSEWFFSL